MALRNESPRMTRWVIWIFATLALSGALWPRPAGLVLMALTFFGLLHLSLLIFEEITQAQYRENMTPTEYEDFCAAVLREQKWRARVTQASGDQGVDIVAEKRGLRIVVQCKKYSKPVGNRAVQEIVAGIAHEEAERGVVVAPCGYTPAAEALAASNNVLLLHHTELRRIDRLLARSQA